MEKVYERPEMEIVVISEEDVLTGPSTTVPGGGDPDGGGYGPIA